MEKKYFGVNVKSIENYHQYQIFRIIANFQGDIKSSYYEKATIYNIVL